MERERRIYGRFLSLLCCVLCGCVPENRMNETVEVGIRLCDNGYATRGLMPDEDMVSNAQVMIFNDDGQLEKSIWLGNGQQSCSASLLKGVRYSLYACANFGYEVKVGSTGDLKDICFHLAYPDEYREGMPMAASVRDFLVTEECTAVLELEKLMAKVSLQMDRGRLSEGVCMNVTSVRIGNCPKKVKPFTISHAESGDDCFRIGFIHDDLGCTPLNSHAPDGMSGELSLYMLENMQGVFSETGITKDKDKVFNEHDPRMDVCSYIEMELEYSYGDLASIGSPLIYRFYLGESLNSLDVERNCHYHITVSPEDDGLHGDGWRVDKSGISFTGIPGLMQYPSDYIRGNIGDTIHIGCHLTPSNAPFDIGLEYLDADKAEGIYDYIVDHDGHGVTLTLTGPGRGLIYMEAGNPINDAALFLIEVNQPL